MDLTKKLNLREMNFTWREVRDLVISALVLGFLFAYRNWSFSNYLFSLAVVAPALILHELAHKFTAEGYDCRAQYKLWPAGILIALMVTLVSDGRVIFAALGAVMISTAYKTRLGYKYVELTREENGKISASGPLTNLALAVVLLLVKPLFPQFSHFFQIGIFINLFLLLFNSLPFPPLDGSKIFGWSRIIWGGMVSAALILLILPGIIGVYLSLFLVLVVTAVIFLFLNYVNPPQRPEVEYPSV